AAGTEPPVEGPQHRIELRGDDLGMLAHMRLDSCGVGEEPQVTQLIDLVRAARDLAEVRDHPVDRGRATAEERDTRAGMGDLRGRSEDPRLFGSACLVTQ